MLRILFVITAACYIQPEPPARVEQQQQQQQQQQPQPPEPPRRHWTISKSEDKCSAAEICEGRSPCDPSPRDYPCPANVTIDAPIKIVNIGDRCAVDIVCPPGAVGYQNCPWPMPCP